MKRNHLLAACSLAVLLFACKKNDLPHNEPKEDPATFAEIGSIDIGDAGAAEITAYDPTTQRLFVVNNSSVNKIDVLDFSNPAAPAYIHSISMALIGGFVNSLDVDKGVLAAAVEAVNKQEPGKVALFNTTTYALIKTVAVGALPDMVTYSPDGKYILTANEGEPSSDYYNDPEGTVSIISVKDNYAVTTIGFGVFAKQQAALVAKGLRVFGPNASFAQDMEPEYITVSDDSRTAWVTLQENNAIAKIDLQAKTVIDIFPLGFKHYNSATNAIDASDRDGAIAFNPQPVWGMYQPDAIAFYLAGGTPLLFTANEGDAREYDAFAEIKRVKDLKLDAAAFPDAAIKTDARLGRLNVTSTLGDTDGDGDYDALYSLGARSFSVWNGNTGAQLYDSGNDLDRRAANAGLYDDGRSDDKGVEPEGLTIGEINRRPVLFVGLERADAVAVYDLTNTGTPRFLKMLPCGDAPEGVLFINAKDCPTRKSLLVVSSENDGVIKVYSTK
ncbi:choice-of-anchor I family protein [Pseudocnuella soli]|uniref:choice-of-anchor I family protein n=1 Tax=Pseudocnuella soli TaxID=2502779 RepID=UPI001049DAC5|nr:choice-of-anchor I family protein [Pseudocnuella soli]